MRRCLSLFLGLSLLLGLCFAIADPITAQADEAFPKLVEAHVTADLETVFDQFNQQHRAIKSIKLVFSDGNTISKNVPDKTLTGYGNKYQDGRYYVEFRDIIHFIPGRDYSNVKEVVFGEYPYFSIKVKYCKSGNGKSVDRNYEFLPPDNYAESKVYVNGILCRVDNYTSYGQNYSFNPDGPKTDVTPAKAGTIYRLYNPADGDHVYTTDEADMRAKTGSGWNLEPSPGVSGGSDGVAIYRIVNVATGENLFTSDKNEVNVQVASGAWRAFNGGAPVFYGAKSGKGFYRLYNPHSGNYPKTAHHFTADPNEVKVLTTQQGWQADNNGQPLFYLAQ